MVEIYDYRNPMFPLRVDESWGYYFAGLADGEGCFLVHRDRRERKYGGHSYYHPRFIIQMRADDEPLIRDLYRRTAQLGRITYKPRRRHAEQPSIVWAVAKKNHCKTLCSIFDRFVLRGKKWRCYQIFREAVFNGGTEELWIRSQASKRYSEIHIG